MAAGELESLINAVLPLAQERLEVEGQFPPFGGAIAADGALELFAREQPDPQQASDGLVEWLRDELQRRASREEIRAAALCFNAEVREPATGDVSDAIYICTEGVDGDVLHVFVKYVVNLDEEYQYSSPQPALGARQFFQTEDDPESDDAGDAHDSDDRETADDGDDGNGGADTAEAGFQSACDFDADEDDDAFFSSDDGEDDEEMDYGPGEAYEPDHDFDLGEDPEADGDEPED